MRNAEPVFVVGVFRSGTSLLCTILNQNPQVALMYECDIWNFPKSLLNFRFRHNWLERMEFYNQSLSRHNLMDGPTPKVSERIDHPSDLYRVFGQMKGASVSGEKSPFYCARLEQLFTHYPKATFVLVWRDPTETYRSVLKAGQTSRFFGRRGMLSRLIYFQEQTVVQGERLAQKGARIFHVNYAQLVDQPEPVCRKLCEFLGVAFAPQMLQLTNADLSSVYRAPHHAHLRRGVIERQKYHKELVSPATRSKLARFSHRWERLQKRWLVRTDTDTKPEPGAVEFFYHQKAGRLLCFYDSCVRAAFEFIPLPWLRVYRQFKFWVTNAPVDAHPKKTSWMSELQEHYPTLVVATSAISLIGWVHIHANPHIMFLLFYLLPCSAVALIVGIRWATLFVLVCAMLGPVIQMQGDIDYKSWMVFTWNSITRFLLMEIWVVFCNRIRLEISKPGLEKAN